MNAADVIGYTYNADCHCIGCTLAAYKAGKFTMQDPLGLGEGNDENGLPYAATDSEGNAVHPIFGSEESECHCGDCGAEICNASEEESES